MLDLFDRAQLPTFSGFTRSGVLLGFDYDGTLAPYADQPDRASLRPRTRALLSEVARLYPCVVISGRPQDDIAARLADIPVREVLGNHGLEPLRRMDDLATQVRLWLPVLEEAVGGLSGVTLEKKTYSVAIHYRHAGDAQMARDLILAAAAKLSGARVIDGHLAFNLLPEGAQHKGIALGNARERLGCERAIYVGDDEADEDVFSLRDSGLLRVRVGQKESSHADFFIRDQERIDDLLWLFTRLRSNAE